jgi:extradiol dioxygenase family protein
MRPLLHLSIPVRDLTEARSFYVDALGCAAGRARPDYQDVWFYGMQITLQDRPEEAAALQAGSVRHFGVTLTRPEFEAVRARLAAFDVRWVSRVSTDDEGQPTEQTKAKVADPSGNVIEIKTYVDPTAALEIPPQAHAGAQEPGR